MPAPTKWFNIRAIARPAAGAVAAATTAEILIYGDIGESWYGDTIAAKDFVREVAALDVDQITIRINSYGGSVTDGIAIFNALKRHKAQVTTVVDGIAASIASLIAMSGDSIQMAENALMMIHAPWLGYTSGNAVDLREQADALDVFAEAMATSYSARSGDKEAALVLLSDGKDHWYTAEQALEAKLIDATVAAMPLEASAQINQSIQARYASFPQLANPAATAAQPQIIPPKESLTMTTPVTAAAVVVPPVVAVAAPPAVAATAEVQAAATAAAQAALQANQARCVAINAAFDKFSIVEGMQAVRQACIDDFNCTADQANAKLLAHLGQGSAPIAGTRIITLEDSRDKFRAGVTASLLARAGLEKDDRTNNYRGYSLFDVARAALEQAGVSVRNMSKMDVVAAAFTHSSSDFPMLLANIAEKSMLKGYDEAEETFQLWTSVGTLGDFKPGKRVDINTFPSLDNIPEGGEYSYADLGDRGETVVLGTYGKLFSMTRPAIINDDLDAFSKIPRAMGRSAVRTIGDLVYAVLTGNPQMADGTALFHANHKNLMNGTAISTGSVDAMGVAMGTQVDGTGNTLNINLAKLIVPRALRGTANVVRDSEFEVGAGTKNNTVPNMVRETFEVISDARLDKVSSTAWYGCASADTNDTVEVSYLDGQQTPTLEQRNGWSVDGVEFKVRHDFGVKALDFRTFQKNPGA